MQRERDTRFIYYMLGVFGVAAMLLQVFDICVTRHVLAIFRGNRLPTRHGYGPICADDPSDA